MRNILIRPIITEKMTKQSEQFNRYGFLVTRNSNKLEIRNAVEKMYNVTVEDVRTLVIPGKRKSRNTKGGLITGKTSPKKKAIVTLAKNDKIDFYAAV